MWSNSRTLLTATAGARDPNVALLRARREPRDTIIVPTFGVSILNHISTEAKTVGYINQIHKKK